MKTQIKTITAFAFMAVLVSMGSCKGKAEQKDESVTEQTEVTAELGKEYTSAYVCPMHCEGSGSETEGNCPKCGMAYVVNEEHTQDGHTHE